MKKYLLVVGGYSGEKGEFFNKYTGPRNKQYCHKNNYEYLDIREVEPLTRVTPGYHGEKNKDKVWRKYTIILDMVKDGSLKYGDIVNHLDGDMAIVKLDQTFDTNKSYTYSIDGGNTHSTALFSVKINDWSVELLQNIVSDERYYALNDKQTLHEAFGNYSCFWHELREQASFYSVLGVKRHSWIPFMDLPNYGWHSNKDEYTVYPLVELYKHLEILPPKWNVTALAGEYNSPFDINKVSREDIIIRHFAGGQPWLKEYFV